MGAVRKTDPRARIMEVAVHLFYTEGVRATGTEKIMSSANVAKATFYRHFPSKDALVLAYLEKQDRSFWDGLLGPPTPQDVHEALIRLDQMVNHPEVTGCPFLRVASEYPETSHPFHCRVIEHKNKLLAYLAELLGSHTGDRKALARKLLTVIDGALSVRMVYGAAKEVPLLASAEAILQDSFGAGKCSDTNPAP